MCICLLKVISLPLVSIYLNTLGEVEGFIDSLQCDNNIIVGNFNADFDHGSISTDLLSDFVLDLNLSVCDLHYRESVKFTYERDDGLVCSWINHIHCSQAISILVTDIYILRSGYLIICHCFSSFTLIILHSLPYLLLHRPNLCALTGLRLLHLILLIIRICFVIGYQTLLLSFCPAPFLIALLVLVG